MNLFSLTILLLPTTCFLNQVVTGTLTSFAGNVIATDAVLIIRNESPFAIRNVEWGGVSFAGATDWINPGTFVARDVASGTGFIRFRVSANDATFRVAAVMNIEEGDQRTFTLLVNTVVVRESDNETGPLYSLLGQ